MGRAHHERVSRSGVEWCLAGQVGARDLRVCCVGPCVESSFVDACSQIRPLRVWGSDHGDGSGIDETVGCRDPFRCCGRQNSLIRRNRHGLCLRLRHPGRCARCQEFQTSDAESRPGRDSCFRSHSAVDDRNARLCRDSPASDVHHCICLVCRCGPGGRPKTPGDKLSGFRFRKAVYLKVVAFAGIRRSKGVRGSFATR